jgi:hypothetical protein
MISKEQVLDRERRWALIVGIASVAAVALILASLGGSSPGEITAERLSEVDADRSTLVVASFVQALGWFLLAIPLVYLFQATSARAPQVRRGLLGLVIIAPIFFGVGGLLNTASVLDAATEFKNVPASEITACVGEKQKQGEATGGDQALTETESGSSESSESEASTTDQIEECRDEAAEDAREDSTLAGVPLPPLQIGFGLAGLLGLTIAMVYLGLWAMRTGLVTRFWGSLGIALGAVFVFFFPFPLIWFIYLGLLFAGWVPGGRPPAWASGEAMPWPKGGPRGKDDDGRDDGGPGDDPGPGSPGGGPVLEGFGQELPEGTTSPEPAAAPEPDAPQVERRKRKKRSS